VLEAGWSVLCDIFLCILALLHPGFLFDRPISPCSLWIRPISKDVPGWGWWSGILYKLNAISEHKQQFQSSIIKCVNCVKEVVAQMN